MGAVFTLSDYVHDDLGNPVGGIRVRAFALNEDGSRGTVHVQEAFTSSTTGRWELVNLDTELTATGQFAIEIRNMATGQTRWRMGDIRLQVGFLTGRDGNAPLNDGSITTQFIGDNAVTDVKIGNRTVDDALATPYANSGQLGTVLSFLARRFKDVLGTENWSSTVPVSLTATLAHINNQTNPHATTAQQVSALQNMGDTRRVYAGTEASMTNIAGATSTVGDLYLATDTRTIYRKTGTSTWTMLVTGNYETLINKPSPTATAYNSDRLSGVRGGLYPQLVSVFHALSSGASISTSNIAMQAGSVVVTTNTSGIANVSPPVSVTGGFITIIVCNGDSDRTTLPFAVKDHFIGSSTYFQVYGGAAATRTIRVNYFILFWS